MPCLLSLIAIFFPRLIIVLLFLFTDYLEVYDTVIWPVVGFIFLPFATLAYALAINGAGELDGIYLLIFVVAVLMDLGSWGGGSHSASRSRR